jgi:hypothetical protein
MAENEKTNYSGIAAIITAVATLVGAFAVFYPRGAEPGNKAPEEHVAAAADAGAAVNGDFCALVHQCMNGVDNDFETIKGVQVDETPGAETVTTYRSKVELPGSISSSVERFYSKDDVSYDFTSTLIETGKREEAEVSYLQANKKLAECLSDQQPVVTTAGPDKTDDSVKTTVYRLKTGAELDVAEIKDSDGTYTVVLTVQADE